MSTKRSVLVTGASGFIGSSIVPALHAAGYKVHASSRTSSPELSAALGTHVIECDLMSPHSANLPAVDAIVHCATANDVACRSPVDALRLCTEGTRFLLDHATRVGASTFLIFSTLQVYGTELFGQVDEGRNVCCETNYASIHYEAERTCSSLSFQPNLVTISLRPANVFGVPRVPTVNRSTLVPMCFVLESLSTGAISLRSSGLQNRNFVPLDDVAQGVVALLSHPLSPGHHTFNVASGWHATVREIAMLVAEIGGDVLGHAIPVHIGAPEPLESNHFHVTCRDPIQSRSASSTRNEMLTTIRDLFKHFRDPFHE